MLDSVELGHATRVQGLYGECVVQTIAAAARLEVSRQILEPKGIDFEVIQDKQDRKPRRKRIEVQVKTHSRITIGADGSLKVRLRRKAYQALNGTVGCELDIPRFLIVVTTPTSFVDYCRVTDKHIEFSNRAYWHDLMGQPDLPAGQDSITLSVSSGNVLTPEALVHLTCGDRGEAARWMSA